MRSVEGKLQFLSFMVISLLQLRRNEILLQMPKIFGFPLLSESSHNSMHFSGNKQPQKYSKMHAVRSGGKVAAIWRPGRKLNSYDWYQEAQ